MHISMALCHNMEIMLRVLIKYMSGMNSSKQDNKWVK